MKKRFYQAPEIVSIKVSTTPLLEESDGINIVDETGGKTQYSKVWDMDEDEE